jgi:CDGSH-type Zn-finger protein
MSEQTTQTPKVVVTKDGPYLVSGDVNLVRKTQISSEHGEPMTWQTNQPIDAGDQSPVALCRCGGSSNKPFCDGTHTTAGFDGTETADAGTYQERRIVHQGSTGIVIKRDYSICASSGFCGHRLANIEKLAGETDDSIVRAQVMAMVERCPSGSYTYSLAEDAADIEPDLPQQVAVTTEMTSEGPIAGPLWVTGRIPVERADGQPVEIRNRMTLCRCGQSENKPFCDGTHRRTGVQE